MSIYCTRTMTGGYWADEDTLPGQVGIYGGSHLYRPLVDNACIVTADVPAWCVPGHEQEHDNDIDRGEWLRLTIASPAGDMTVLLDQTAAQSLRDELSDWIGLPKIKERA